MSEQHIVGLIPHSDLIGRLLLEFQRREILRALLRVARRKEALAAETARPGSKRRSDERR